MLTFCPQLGESWATLERLSVPQLKWAWEARRKSGRLDVVGNQNPQRFQGECGMEEGSVLGLKLINEHSGEHVCVSMRPGQLA